MRLEWVYLNERNQPAMDGPVSGGGIQKKQFSFKAYSRGKITKKKKERSKATCTLTEKEKKTRRRRCGPADVQFQKSHPCEIFRIPKN